MKKIIFLCVNYNSYNELSDFLESVDAAAKFSHDIFDVEVAVADNTTVNMQEIDTKKYAAIKTQVFPFYENKGYLGGIFEMLNSLADKEYDFFVFSNVDLKLSETFLSALSGVNIDDIGWIAPRILSVRTQKDENPYMISRPTISKIDWLRRMYSLPVLYSSYLLVHKFRHRKKQNISKSNLAMDIYAGHGSIMIFTKQFLSDHDKLSFPSFLYGEEIYLAELVRLSGLKVRYCPDIEVRNIGNISTKFLGNRKKCEMQFNSLTQLKEMFFLP